MYITNEVGICLCSIDIGEVGVVCSRIQRENRFWLISANVGGVLSWDCNARTPCTSSNLNVFFIYILFRSVEVRIKKCWFAEPSLDVSNMLNVFLSLWLHIFTNSTKRGECLMMVDISTLFSLAESNVLWTTNKTTEICSMCFGPNLLYWMLNLGPVSQIPVAQGTLVALLPHIRFLQRNVAKWAGKGRWVPKTQVKYPPMFGLEVSWFCPPNLAMGENWTLKKTVVPW